MNSARWWLRQWSHRGWVARLLWPVSMLYRALLAARRAAYQSGWLNADVLPVPVLVVGNVYVGGAGKTPLTMALAQRLGEHGWRVGLISRGHGRTGQDALEVQLDSLAHEVGDEPLLMRRRTGLPVAVARRRSEAGRLLLAHHPDINLLISDDGLQHLALHHDLALCLFDQRRLGNGWVLPAGPLREPWPRRPISEAPTWKLSSEQPPWGPAWGVQRSLSLEAVNGLGQRVSLTDPGVLPGPLNALAGIAQPEVFFQALRSLGLPLKQTQAYPDHDPLNDWQAPAPGTWLCTEKDAVKLWPQHPEVWAVPLEVGLPDELVQNIDAFMRTKLSSPHGQQTA
jgi:tetraacyldisaccharide 4'-kinase